MSAEQKLYLHGNSELFLLCVLPQKYLLNVSLSPLLFYRPGFVGFAMR